LTAKRALVAQLRTEMENASEPASTELGSVDMVLIRNQMARFERRLEYWSNREQELSTASAGRQARRAASI
jgi:hypothetical protein